MMIGRGNLHWDHSEDMVIYTHLCIETTVLHELMVRAGDQLTANLGSRRL